MNHEEATKYLDDLGDRVHNRRPPIGEIIRAGKVAKRRRSQRALALSAAAVVFAVGFGWTAQHWVDEDRSGVDRNIATTPPKVTLPDEATVGGYECPPIPASARGTGGVEVPAPDDATGLTADLERTVAAWFEPNSGPLPYLVVYDLVRQTELAREDLGVGEDLRSSSLRLDKSALYYQSSADPNVWLRYRWSVDDYPSVFALCTE